MKLIDLHYKWMKNELLPDCGLCYSLPKKYKKTFYLFYPIELRDWQISAIYWADTEHESGSIKRMFTYGILRQNIVLFICAMHNEI